MSDLHVVLVGSKVLNCDIIFYIGDIKEEITVKS